MADNVQFHPGSGADPSFRALDLGSGVVVQAVIVGEGLTEQPVATTGGTVVYSVDSSPAVALDPPTAAARYCRIRAFDTAYDPATAATMNHRLFYREDGTTPTADGANATGYLLHGEMMLVRLTDFTDFLMIAETADNHTWTVYAEWLTIPSS